MPAKSLPQGLDLSRPAAPRWVASPRLRRLGFTTSHALKKPDGSYMTRGEAVDAVDAINRMIRDRDAGLAARGPWAFLAPTPTEAAPVILTPRSIGGQLDAYKASSAYTDLAPTTQANYRQFLSRLVDALAGWPAGRPGAEYLPSDRARLIEEYEADVKTTLARDISCLCADDNPLQGRYDALCRIIHPRTGLPQIHNANGVLVTASVWLGWVHKQRVDGKRIIPFNPAADVKRKPSPGRVVVWTDAEVKDVCDEARADGWLSMAFAVETAVELSWSKKDILALTWGQVRDNRVRGVRAKTGNLVHTTLTRSGRNLFARMLAAWRTRMKDDNGTLEPGPLEPIFVVDARANRIDNGAVGKPWNKDYFEHEFAKVRGACKPPIINRFQDLRDTAITRMKEAGLTDHEIQSRSQHSLVQIRNILDKHYGLTTLDISDDAAEKLNERARRKHPKPV